MRLKFAQEGKRFVCNFRLSQRYTGPPGHCHGGIIATILDDAMSKLNKLRHVIAVTSSMTVEYLKPVPLHKPLRVESHELSKRGRRLTHAAEILDANNEAPRPQPRHLHHHRPRKTLPKKETDRVGAAVPPARASQTLSPLPLGGAGLCLHRRSPISRGSGRGSPCKSPSPVSHYPRPMSRPDSHLRIFAPALILLVISVFINYIDRGNLSIAASTLKDELHISAKQLGDLLAAFF